MFAIICGNKSASRMCQVSVNFFCYLELVMMAISHFFLLFISLYADDMMMTIGLCSFLLLSKWFDDETKGEEKGKSYGVR